MTYCFELHIFPRKADAVIDASKFVAALEVLCDTRCVDGTTELRHGTEQVEVVSRLPESEIKLLMSSDFSLRWIKRNGNTSTTKPSTTKTPSASSSRQTSADAPMEVPPTIPFVYKAANGDAKQQALNLSNLRIISTKDLMLWSSYVNLEYASDLINQEDAKIACECGFDLTYRCRPITISSGFGNNVRMMHSCPQCTKKTALERLQGVFYNGVLGDAKLVSSLDLVPACGYVISMDVSRVYEQMDTELRGGSRPPFDRLETFAVDPELISKLEKALDCTLVQMLTAS